MSQGHVQIYDARGNILSTVNGLKHGNGNGNGNGASSPTNICINQVQVDGEGKDKDHQVTPSPKRARLTDQYLHRSISSPSSTHIFESVPGSATTSFGANGSGSVLHTPICNGSSTALLKDIFLIGVAGGTASGKTTVCDKIIQELHDHRVVLISQDSYYRGLTETEKLNVHEYNFDHPDAIDSAQLYEDVLSLKDGNDIKVPVYDFQTHSRKADDFRVVKPADVVIIEGILVLQFEKIRNALNMKIFVDTDDDVRLARRIQRDTQQRGRDVNGVIRQYTAFVKPMFDAHVLPSKKFADVIIPWARGDNNVAIDLIVQHIRTKLGTDDLRRIYPLLSVIQSNFQIRGMHTIIRDRNTAVSDFIFYADRLIKIVVEAGLGLLPFTEKHIETPTGAQYVGVEFCRSICGVSIIRSGESMENALRACCKGIKIGKILIHRRHDGDIGKEIKYHRLPEDIDKRRVLLMDPILATGNSICRAIQLLRDHDVPEDHIIILTIIAAPQGIHKLYSKFPSVKLITSEVDDNVKIDGRIVPGIGEFGDRYFGTDND